MTRGASLPSHAYSGNSRGDPSCRPHHGKLFSDGLAGQAAWCAVSASVGPQSFLQIDMKNQFYVRQAVTQGTTAHPSHLIGYQ